MDEIDLTTERSAAELAALIRRNSAPLQPGIPGECAYCGENSARLVLGACAPCRDRRGLP